MRWGQWPIILLKWSAELTDNTGYTEQRLFGRQMAATADTVAIFVILIIGWRLYSLRHGLLAGALSSLAVMQIQQSHFMTSDMFAVAFTALTMWMGVEVALSVKPGATPTRATPVGATHASPQQRRGHRPSPFASRPTLQIRSRPGLRN